MRFDPKLQISASAAYEIAVSGFAPGGDPVLISSAYPAPLACETASGGEIFVRAATGDEVAKMLRTGLTEEGDTLDWPGDPPVGLDQVLDWRERAGGPIEAGESVHLWAGEVIFTSGKGLAGPFYVDQTAAAAWAFSTALGHPLEDVFECQVVPYACVREFAPGVLRGGEAEARRLGRFDVAPLRPWGTPLPVYLPGRGTNPETD